MGHDQVVAEPEVLERFTDEVLATLPPARAEIDVYQQALWRYQSAPNDLRTRCRTDLGIEAEALLTELAVFDELPAVFAGALRTLDAESVGSAQAGWSWDSAWTLYDHSESAHASGVALARQRRVVRTTAALKALEQRARISHRDLLHTGANRAVRRQWARSLRRGARGRLPTARAQLAAAQRAVAHRPSLLSRASAAAAGRAPWLPGVARAVGRPLGVVSIGLQIQDTVQATREGDYATAGFTGAGAVGAGLLMISNPVTLTTGAALVVGSLAYYHRHGAMNVARGVGRTASRVGGWIRDRFRSDDGTE